MQNKVLKIKKKLTFISSFFFYTFEGNRNYNGPFRRKIQYFHFF